MSYPGDLTETLLSAANISTQVGRFSSSMLDSVNTQVHPYYAGVGSTINLVTPTLSSSNVSDIGNGAISDVALADTTVALPLNKKASASFKIQLNDQLKTPMDIAQTYLTSRMEDLVRFIDNDVCSLITAAAFSTNGSTALGADTVTRGNIATMWGLLASQGTPLTDVENLFFMTHSTVFANMLNETTLVQESIVGINAAEISQRRAVLLKQFGAEVRYDQNFPIPTSGIYAALLFHRGAVAVRTAIEEPQYNQTSKSFVVYPKPNIPIRVEYWYDPALACNRVALSCVYGRAVVNQAWGAFGTTS